MAASSFKKIEPVRLAKFTEQITPDAIYWKQLEFPVTFKNNGAVSHIEFSPVAPHNYAVTSSTKVQIHCHRTNQPIKSLTRFRQTAYCCSYRNDGQLLVAGSEEPLIRIFSGKKVLRELKGHTGPVHVTHFTRDSHHIFSASDDLSVKIWDVASQEVVTSFSEHQDYIRCGAVSPISGDTIVTGSYDHRVKLWDIRSANSVLTLNHGHPVESVLVHPSGGLIFSAGGNVVKVWDAVGGGRQLLQLSNHHKTVTSMCMASDNRRLLTASLDRHVKFYDTSSYQLVHSLDYPSPILSVCVAPGDDLVAVGMTDGLLSVQRRTTDEMKEAKEREKRLKKRKQGWVKYTHTPVEPAQGDDIIKKQKREKMEKYDVCLRRFQYSKALDAAMDLKVRSKEPEVTVSVILELIRRGGIAAALAGRDDKSVSSIVTFILKNFSQPGFINTLLDILQILMGLYKSQIDQMPLTLEVLTRLSRAVDVTVDTAFDRSGTVALCDLVLSAANAPSLPNEQSLSNKDPLLGNHKDTLLGNHKNSLLLGNHVNSVENDEEMSTDDSDDVNLDF